MLLSNYPEYIEVGDQLFKLNTDFRVALRCFEVIEDNDIDDYERSLALIYLLLGDVPTNVDLDKVLQLLCKYLRCGQAEDDGTKPRDMDLLYDEKYIVASFMSDYRLDLSTIDYLHWYQFITLLGGLTNDCILNRVRELRTMETKDYKGKTKTKLERAKRELALPTKHVQSDEEKDAMAKFDALFETVGDNELASDDALLVDVEE